MAWRGLAAFGDPLDCGDRTANGAVITTWAACTSHHPTCKVRTTCSLCVTIFSTKALQN